MRAKTISLRGSTLVRTLGAIIGFLLLAGLGVQVLKYEFGHPHVHGLVDLFSLDVEGGAGAYFSSLQLFLAGVLLILIAFIQQDEGGRTARYWTVLAVSFFLLSTDEAVSLHELTARPIQDLLGTEKKLGFLYFGWVIPATAAVIVFGLYFIPFLRQLPTATRRGFVLGAVIFVGGAVGVESLTGRIFEGSGFDSLPYHVFVLVEEGMEMVGILVFIRTLLRHLTTLGAAVTINLTPENSAARR
jgi:hypothetical protein